MNERKLRNEAHFGIIDVLAEAVKLRKLDELHLGEAAFLRGANLDKSELQNLQDLLADKSGNIPLLDKIRLVYIWINSSRPSV